MNIKNIERKMQDFNANLTLFEQQFIIIPYLPSGYVDYSNFGQVPGQRVIDNFETYKRVWTGNDSFILTWKDSVEYSNTTNDPKIKYKFKIGDYFAGWLEQNSSDVDITTDNSFTDYKSQTTEKTITFRINATKFDLDTNYEFMFYKVPEMYGNIIFRVVNLEREYLGNDLMCYVLTLKSLNQELANTGRAKQQNVMPCAPGDGYWDAMITNIKPENDEYKEFAGRYIVPNKDKQLINPCKKVVVKAFGMCALSNVAFWGRRVRRGTNNGNFGIPRWIFPMNFKNASTYTLYRTQNEQSNYYWVRKLSPIIRFDKPAMDAMKSLLSANHAWSSEGFVKINQDVGGITNMRATNQTTIVDNEPTASYPEQLFGKVLGGNYSPWLIDIKQEINQKTDLIYGCKQKYTVAYDALKPIPIHDLMYHSFWLQKNMKTLPISAWNTLDFGFTLSTAQNMLAIRNWYGAAALVGIGIAGTAYNLALAPKFEGFSCIVPCSLMDFMIQECTSIFNKNYLDMVKLSYFTSFERDNEINKFFNTETINTSFEADLTDMLNYKYSGSTYRSVSTACIGQKLTETNQSILPGGEVFLLDGNQSLISVNDGYEGWIIDAIHIQGLFQGDYSIEFLDFNNDVIWSGVYQSQGKWSNSIREINTWINTSIYGRENMFLDAPLEWPKKPPELDIIDNDFQPIVLEYNPNQVGRLITYFYERSDAAGRITMKQIFPQMFKENHTNTFAGIANFNHSSGYIFERTGVVIKQTLSGTLDEFVKNYQSISFDADISSIAPSRNGTPPYETISSNAQWYKSDGTWKGRCSFTKQFRNEPIKFKLGNAEFTGYTTWDFDLELKTDSSNRVFLDIRAYVGATSFSARYSTPGQIGYTQIPYPEQIGKYVQGDRNWEFIDGDRQSSVSNGCFVRRITLNPTK